MKKINLFSLALASIGLVLGLSSCKKCQTCSYGSDSYEVCQDDFGSKSAYNAYIDLAEAFGATCK